MPIQVIKASGETEPFDESKLIASLRYSKIPDDIAAQAVGYVKAKLIDQTSTAQIHSHIQEYFKTNQLLGASLKYDLKYAIMRLGPTGYPFEKFVAKVLAAYGYLTQTGVTITGKCVNHEIDIDVTKDHEHYLVECKFHNLPGIKTDIQVALYTYARFVDVRSALELLAAHHQRYHQAWLVTNTKITKDVVDYARCMDMKVVSWGFPREGNLRELIIGSGLHPITIIRGIDQKQLQHLFERDMVTCADLKRAIDNNDLPVTYSPEAKQDFLNQIREVCL